MLYIIYFLMLLTGWLNNWDGKTPKMIAGFSIILAVILLIFGFFTKTIDLKGLLFILFIISSVFTFTRIYRISFLPQNFIKITPVFLGFGVVIGYLLVKLSFSDYFIWFIILTSGFLLINFQKQKKESSNPLLLLFKSEEEKPVFKKFIKDTLRFNFISSIMYIIMVIISYLYLFHGKF